MLHMQKNSVFERYTKCDEVFVIVQTRAFFPSGLRMLQMAVPNKWVECWNSDTLYLKRSCSCVFLRCIIANIQQGAWACKNRHLPLCSCNSIEPGAHVKRKSFQVIVHTLWCKILSSQQKLTTGTRHPELVVEYTTQFEHRFDSHKPVVEQCSSNV